MKPRLLLYAHFNVSEEPNTNLTSFLQTADLGSADVRVISNSKIAPKHRLAYTYQPDSFFDFGMWRDYLNSIDWKVQNYERIVLVNCSVFLQNPKFLSLFDHADPQAMVGTILNTEFFPHVQSFFLGLTPEQLSVARASIFQHAILDTQHRRFLAESAPPKPFGIHRRRAAFMMAKRNLRTPRAHPSKTAIIQECEIGISRTLVEAGFSLQTEMHGMKSMNKTELLALPPAKRMGEIMHSNTFSFVKRTGYA